MAAATPVRTKMPVPTIAPIPSIVRPKVPRTRFIPPSCFVSEINSLILLVLKMCFVIEPLPL